MANVKGKDKKKVAAFRRYLTAVLDGSGRSMREIGEDLNYDGGNIISMWKSGATQVPLHKVVPLADAIGVRRDILMRLALEAYAPDILKAMDESFGFLVTDDERDFLKEARKLVKRKRLELRSQEQKSAFKSYVETLPDI